jgi:hypothetical protein
MRKCTVEGCARTPEPGWARCRSHVDAWLDRLLVTRSSFPKIVEALRDEYPTSEADWPTPWAPGEIMEEWGK